MKPLTSKARLLAMAASLALTACGGGGGGNPASGGDGGGGGGDPVTPTPTKAQTVNIQFDADYIGSFREPELVAGDAFKVIDRYNGVPIPPEFYTGTPLHVSGSTLSNDRLTTGAATILIQPGDFIGVAHRITNPGNPSHSVYAYYPNVINGKGAPRDINVVITGRWSRIANESDKTLEITLQIESPNSNQNDKATSSELVVQYNADIPAAYGATRGPEWYAYEPFPYNESCECDGITMVKKEWEAETKPSETSTKAGTSLGRAYEFVVTFRKDFNSPFGRGPHHVSVTSGDDADVEGFTQDNGDLKIEMTDGVKAAIDQAPQLAEEIVIGWLKAKDGVYGVAKQAQAPPRLAVNDTAPDRNIVTNRHIDDINAVRLYEDTNNGMGTVVCVTDDGFSAGGEDVPIPPVEYSGDGSGSAQADGDKHGTAVTSLISSSPENGGLVGLAHNSTSLMANIFAVRSGFRFSEVVIEGIEFCINNGASVVNGSWGYHGDSSKQGDILGVSEVIDTFVDDGGFLVFAAGNAGMQYPNTEKNLTQGYINVAATEFDTDTQVYYTNVGASMDIAAPGWEIHTISDDSGDSPVFDVISGTSFAAPIVSGVIATIVGENANFDSYWFDRLIGTGVGVQRQHLVGDLGAGVIEADGLLDAAKNLPSSAGMLFSSKYSFRPAYDGQQTVFHLKSRGEDVLAAEVTPPVVAGLDIVMADDVDGEVKVTMTATDRGLIANALGNQAEITFTRNGDNMPFVLAGMENQHSLTESHKGVYWVGITRDNGSEFKLQLADPEYDEDKAAFALDVGYQAGVSPDDISRADLCFSPTFRPTDTLKTCTDITAAYTSEAWGDIASEDAAVNVTYVLRAN